MQTKQIQSLITKAVKAANISKQAIQDAIDATVKHAWQHGDVSLINRLVTDLPKGVQLEKIKQYLQEVAPVRPNKAIDVADKGYYKYRKLSEDSQAISLSILADCAWWDYQPIKQQQVQGVDTAKIFRQALTNLLQKLQNQTDLTPLEQDALIAMERAVNSRIGEGK